MTLEPKDLQFPLNQTMNAEQILNSHRRRKNFAPNELNIIISMVEENADLIYNRVNKNQRFISKQDFWQTVTKMINENCNFTAKRDIKEVRRKWVTFQSEVKSKARDGANVLTHHEKRVYDLIMSHNHDVGLGEERLTMLPLSSGSGTAPTLSPQASSPGGGSMTLSNDIVSSLASNLTSNLSSNLASNLSSNLANLSGTISGTTFPNQDEDSLQEVDVKVEPPSTDSSTSAELLMNICSQVMGGIAPTDLTYQVNSIKDMISSTTSTPTSISEIIPVVTPRGVLSTQDDNKVATTKPSPSQLLPTSNVTPLLVTPVVATSLPSVTPVRNVVPVQPVNSVQNTSKRSRLDNTSDRLMTPPDRCMTSSSSVNQRLSSERAVRQNGSGVTSINGVCNTGVCEQVAFMLGDLVEHQKEGNRIALERLEVARQRMGLEKEKLEIEKARYEIEKERLCQEIITRKKGT